MITYVFSFMFSLLLTTCSMHSVNDNFKPTDPEKRIINTSTKRRYALQKGARDCLFGGMEHDGDVWYQRYVYEPIITSEKSTQTGADTSTSDDLCNNSFTSNTLGQSITSPSQITPEQRSQGNSPLIFTPQKISTSEQATQTEADTYTSDDLCNNSFAWSTLGRSITSPSQITPEQRIRGNSPLIFTPAEVAFYIQQDLKRPSQSNSFRITTIQNSTTQPDDQDSDFEKD